MKPRLVCERAHAKINLALHILGRRPDGYHELDSIVAFADVADVLTITPADAVVLEISGPFAQDLQGIEENTVLAAWRLLSGFSAQRNQPLSPVRFHLEKNLPIAAGIGGGSADAAAALRGLVRYFDLEVTAQELHAMALRLGADVPVCLVQQCRRMRGLGDIIETVAITLPPALVLVNPRVATPTSGVFGTLGLERGQSFATAIEHLRDAGAWRNDLTSAAMKTVPEIATVMGVLESHPAITQTRMSGSGATCFGVAETRGQADVTARHIAAQHPDWWVVAASLG